MPTLLEQAKAMNTHSRRAREHTEEELDLIIAWCKEEITMGVLNAVIGEESAQGFFARIAKSAIAKGNLIKN